MFHVVVDNTLAQVGCRMHVHISNVCYRNETDLKYFAYSRTLYAFCVSIFASSGFTINSYEQYLFV